jgi:hypothetical protein
MSSGNSWVSKSMPVKAISAATNTKAPHPATVKPKCQAAKANSSAVSASVSG